MKVSHAQGSASVMALGRLANDNSGGISANARKRFLSRSSPRVTVCP